jgi:hypothetical protein
LLCACSGPYLIAAYQTPDASVRVQQAPDNKEISVIANGKPVALPGYTAARVVGIWDTDSSSLFLIAGAKPGCPVSYELLAVDKTRSVLSPVGHCGEHYAITALPDKLVVKAIDKGAADQWLFRDGTVVEVAGEPPPRRPRRKLARGERPDANAASAQVSDSLVPPTISEPVGDNVIPQRIGAGPLPQGGVAAPTLFKEH